MEERDPITRLRKRMAEIGLFTEASSNRLEAQAKVDIDRAVAFAIACPEPDSDRGRSPTSTPPDQGPHGRPSGRCAARATVKEISYAAALREAHARGDAARPERVFIMGEDVGLYGGAYGATRGLFEEFGGERVLDTPISEATIGGAAVGAAMAGMRPIAEIMYVDFTPLAMDQIVQPGRQEPLHVRRQDQRARW